MTRRRNVGDRSRILGTVVAATCLGAASCVTNNYYSWSPNGDRDAGTADAGGAEDGAADVSVGAPGDGPSDGAVDASTEGATDAAPDSPAADAQNDAIADAAMRDASGADASNGDASSDAASHDASGAEAGVCDTTTIPSCSGVLPNNAPLTADPLTITTPTQVTVSSLGHLPPQAFSIRDCNTPFTDLACSNEGDWIITALLQPGNYNIMRYGSPNLTIEQEPPWPPPSNTSCATARYLAPPPSSFLEDRIVASVDRYYIVQTQTKGFMVGLYVTSAEGAGHFSVYSVCGDSNTLLGSGNGFKSASPGGVPVSLPNAPPGNYFVVAGADELGTQWRIGVSPSP